HLRDGDHPFVAGGALNAGKARQALVLAKDLFDHGVERLCPALRLADEAAQSLAILRGIAQAVDMVETQALQLAVGDELLDQPMRRLEGRGVFHPQAGEAVDVEEAAVVDIARRKTPVAELVVLPLQEVMQRERLYRAIPGGAIGRKSAFDD